MRKRSFRGPALWPALALLVACSSTTSTSPSAGADVTSTTTTAASSPSSDAPSPPAPSELGTWRGNASVAVDSYWPCGPNGELIKSGAGTATLPVTVVVGNPLPDDQNSFVLSIATEPQTADGGISLLSSGRIDASTGPLTVAYWRLTRSGTSIEGELIDTHVAEASAQTLYYTEQFLDPCSDRLGTVPAALAVKEGAKISGDLGTPLAELRFEGQTIDGSRVFSVTMSLSRTQ